MARLVQEAVVANKGIMDLLLLNILSEFDLQSEGFPIYRLERAYHSKEILVEADHLLISLEAVDRILGSQVHIQVMVVVSHP